MFVFLISLAELEHSEDPVVPALKAFLIFVGSVPGSAISLFSSTLSMASFVALVCASMDEANLKLQVASMFPCLGMSVEGIPEGVEKVSGGQCGLYHR